MQVTRIDQIAVAVEDLAAAIAFYERAFGLEVAFRETGERDGVEEVTFLVGGCKFQLLAPTRPDSPIARFLQRKGPGLHHVGLEVADLDDSLAHLRDQGLRLIDDQPRLGGGGARIAFVHPGSAGGVLYELVESTGESG